jgi:hypothetical protein
MLAFAAQGLPGESGGRGSEIRGMLTRASNALSGLADEYLAAIYDAKLEPAEPYQAFLSVLERDAANARAAVGLVLAQSTISSQLIDNLNASIHLRSLLTDLFLIDEILRPQPASGNPASGAQS